MEIGPIWRAMMRNKTGAILIALQIAVTMAIMVNAVSIMQDRSTKMARPSGVDEHNIFYISSVGFAEDFNERAAIEEDLTALRAMPGVVNAIQSNSVPLSGGGWSMGLQTEPGEEIDGTGVAIYFVDEHGLDTFGLNLLSGKNFDATEIEWRERTANEWPANTIITQAMSEALFPDEPDGALGKTVYINSDEPITVIGIIEQMQAPWNGWDGVERVMLAPTHTLFGATRYIIRTEPGMRDELMPKVEALLAEMSKPNQQAQEAQQLAAKAENDFKASQTLALTSQAGYDDARASKATAEAQAVPVETETNRIKAMTQDLNQGEEDAREFDRRLKLGALKLKEREVAIKEDTVPAPAPEQAPQLPPQGLPL